MRSKSQKKFIGKGVAILLVLCLIYILGRLAVNKYVPTPDAPNNEPASVAAQSLTLEDIDFDSYSESLAKSIGLKNGEDRWAAVDKMRLYFAPKDGTTILNTKTSKFERPDGSVLIYTVSGLKDDSIKAQELFMIFAGDKDAQTLGAYGLKQQCYRGDNTTEWTTEHCS